MPEYTCRLPSQASSSTWDPGLSQQVANNQHLVDNTPRQIINSSTGGQFVCPSGEVPYSITISGYIGRFASINYWNELYVSTNNGTSGPHARILRFWDTCQGDGGSHLTHTGQQPGGETYSYVFNEGFSGKGLCLYVTNGASSDLYWSIQIKIKTIAKPRVNVGDVITKAQMDALKNYQSWKNITATAATQGAAATAALANTYGRGTVSAGGTIQASWYNV